MMPQLTYCTVVMNLNSSVVLAGRIRNSSYSYGFVIRISNHVIRISR